MRSILILLFLTLSLNLHAQTTESETVVYTAALQKGQQFSFGEKSLRFKEVVSDSRCPRNVTCIWPGEAKVLLEVFENGKVIEEKVVVINSAKIPLKFSAEGISYFLNSMVLLPYPVAGNETLENYTLNLQITGKPKEI